MIIISFIKKIIEKTIGMMLFKYGLNSVASWLIDNGVYYLLLTLFGLKYKAVFQILGTLLSSIFNFNVNKFWVYESKGNYGKEIMQYYCVCIPRLIIAVVLANIIQDTIGTATPAAATVVKFMVDVILFIATFFIQKKWVFKKDNED